ncbi:MAG: hypothetical protein LLF96_00625 [Eubacteriales bacterium]|nr:hypothetical protein [Eubacteriales bacterium]
MNEKQMKKRVRETILLRTADGYFLAGDALYKTQKNTISFLMYYVSPYIVNMALACELYLKYIYAISKADNTVHVQHDLCELYRMLDDQMQKSIKEEFQPVKTITGESLLSFNECLCLHKLAFIDFRYMYETGEPEFTREFEPASLYNLAVALKNTAIKLSNE